MTVTSMAPKAFRTSSASQKMPYLDFVRALAAFLVLAGHLRAFVFVDYIELNSPNIATMLFYVLTGFGHQSVIVFFVLSGFLIGRSVHDAEQHGTWSFKRYATQRVGRLWTVLVPALIITAALDHLGILLGHMEFYSGGLFDRLSSGPNPQVPADWSFSTFLQNLVFLQTIESPVFGSNGPLWSLANEFWYYVMFPLLYFALAGRKTLTRSACGLIFLLLALWLPFGLVSYGAIWFMGFVSSLTTKFIVQKNFVLTALHFFGAFLFLLSLVYSKNPHFLIELWLPSDFLVGLSFAVWLVPLSLLGSPPRFVASVLHGLASISFTLYLVHFPFISLIVLVILSGEQLHPSVWGVTLYAFVILAALGFSALTYWIFERHTPIVQKALWAVMSRA